MDKNAKVVGEGRHIEPARIVGGVRHGASADHPHIKHATPKEAPAEEPVETTSDLAVVTAKGIVAEEARHAKEKHVRDTIPKHEQRPAPHKAAVHQHQPPSRERHGHE